MKKFDHYNAVVFMLWVAYFCLIAVCGISLIYLFSILLGAKVIILLSVLAALYIRGGTL